jgi:hypothetical protein
MTAGRMYILEGSAHVPIERRCGCVGCADVPVHARIVAKGFASQRRKSQLPALCMEVSSRYVAPNKLARNVQAAGSVHANLFYRSQVLARTVMGYREFCELGSWYVKTYEDSLYLFIGGDGPIDGEELTQDEMSRCGLLDKLKALRTADGSVPGSSLPISERQFCHWRGYVTTHRVVPPNEMVQFEAALSTAVVAAVFQVRSDTCASSVWKYVVCSIRLQARACTRRQGHALPRFAAQAASNVSGPVRVDLTVKQSNIGQQRKFVCASLCART